MKPRFIIYACALVVTGCASSGPIPIGQDTFMITKQSATVFPSGSSMKAEVYKEAFAYCASIGKEFQPIIENSADGVYGRSSANAEVQFRCLAKGDSEIQRPTMRPSANIRIETSPSR